MTKSISITGLSAQEAKEVIDWLVGPTDCWAVLALNGHRIFEFERFNFTFIDGTLTLSERAVMP